MTIDQSLVTAKVNHWLQRIVLGLELCPFARREIDNNKVRFSIAEETSEEALLMHVEKECLFLESNPTVETTLLVIPTQLRSFNQFLEFLDLANGLVEMLNFEGVFQLASFHPDYQFAGTTMDAAENYTNRSPYPIIHILREKSISTAIKSYPDADKLAQRNIAKMEKLGRNKLQSILKDC